MRPHVWKTFGGVGTAAAVITAVLILGRSDNVAGDPPAGPSSLLPGETEPGMPYDLGPGAIPYAEQSATEQQNIDRVHAQLEANQPAESHEAFDRAADEAVARAQSEIAERLVGLEGTEEQGVVP